MNRLNVSTTPLAGAMRVHRVVARDPRGSFARLFCADELAACGWHGAVAQINHSVTFQRGSIRGMHFQRGDHAEAKLVSCVRGEIFDVAVDLRPSSETYLHWHGERLDAASGSAMLIPPGFAHGFQTLSHDVELIYCHSVAYAQEAECGIHPLDPAIGIVWPEPPGAMSDRDRAHLPLTEDFRGVVV